MNLTNKILTVFALLLGLVFLGFAVTIFAMHDRARPIEGGMGLKHQLQQQQAINEGLLAEKERLKIEWAAEKDRYKKKLVSVGN